MQGVNSTAAPGQAQGPSSAPASQSGANIFTAEQLHVLRNQILAFRLVKVQPQHDCTTRGTCAHPFSAFYFRCTSTLVRVLRMRGMPRQHSFAAPR